MSEKNYENFQDNLPPARGWTSRTFPTSPPPPSLHDYEADVKNSQLRLTFILIEEDKHHL
jgi:hypothetical protein